ncbi:MAG: hypothetical protein H5T86_01900 [Armatimonadetes bacterium]|nr:hypothetical protein [Armatimonadota bacterium]
MNPWPDDDPEVQEVLDENLGRFRYRGGSWYGGINPRTGRWDLRVHAAPADALRLSQRVMEKKMERQRREMEEQQAEQTAEAAGAAGPRQRAARLGQWGMGVATGFGAHVATMVSAGAMALTPVVSHVLSMAVEPLGGTGQASVQVGISLLQFLANSIRSVARIGGMVLGVALYSVLGPAFGIAFGFLTAELGALLGNFGQALGQALAGVRGVFQDINRLGRETADVIMEISYAAGLAAESATRLTTGLQAAGVPLQAIGRLFGRWEARPEILGLRMAAFGLDYGRPMQGDLTQLAAWVQGQHELLRVPMLRAAFGPGAEQLLPVLREYRKRQRSRTRGLKSLPGAHRRRSTCIRFPTRRKTRWIAPDNDVGLELRQPACAVAMYLTQAGPQVGGSPPNTLQRAPRRPGKKRSAADQQRPAYLHYSVVNRPAKERARTCGRVRRQNPGGVRRRPGRLPRAGGLR